MHWETKEPCDGTTDLGDSGCGDRVVAVIVDFRFVACDVDAEVSTSEALCETVTGLANRRWWKPGGERSLYIVEPEVTRYPDPTAPTELFNLLEILCFGSEEGYRLRELRIGPILSVFIGKYPGDASFGSSLDQITLDVRSCRDG